MSRSFECNFLENSVKKVIEGSRKMNIQRSTAKFVSYMSQDNLRDYTIVYKSVRIHVHKFILASVSSCFHKKWSHQWESFEPIESDLSSELNVDEQEFESFCNVELKVTTENIFDVFHLSFVFELDKLKVFCKDLLSRARVSHHWVLRVLQQADTAGNYEIVKELNTVLQRIPKLEDVPGVELSADVFEYLSVKLNPYWVLKCVSASVVSKTAPTWGSKQLLDILGTWNLVALNLYVVFCILEPLLHVQELFPTLCQLSAQIMQTNFQTFPVDWFLTLVQKCDNYVLFDGIDQLTSVIEEVMTLNKCTSPFIFPLQHSSLELVLKHCKSHHLVLWSLHLLAESWKVKTINIHAFKFLLPLINVSMCDPLLVYDTLSDLIQDETQSLQDYVCHFLAASLMPRMMCEITSLREHIAQIPSSHSTRSSVSSAAFDPRIIGSKLTLSRNGKLLSATHTDGSLTNCFCAVTNPHTTIVLDFTLQVNSCVHSLVLILPLPVRVVIPILSVSTFMTMVFSSAILAGLNQGYCQV
ncbi:hypothetical protein RCL1_006199 [Eukaryota sp. TZLM3-RCL]